MLGIADGDRGRPLDSDPPGIVHALRTTAYSRVPAPAGVPLEVIRGTAEQSNSAVLFDHRLFLKVFRRIEPGINPDFEIGKFLSERTPFDRIPRTVGAIEYHRTGFEPATLAVLQSLVRNQGTGWEHALHELRLFYEEVNRLAIPVALVRRAIRPNGPEVPHSCKGWWVPISGGRHARPAHRRAPSCPGQRRERPGFRPGAADLARPHGAAGDIRTQFAKTLDVLKDTLDRLPEAIAPQARRCSTRRRACWISSTTARPETVLDQDPLPRRLPPGPGPADRRGLRHPRLRGRARQAPGRAAAEAIADQGRGRDAPLLRLRGLRGAVRVHQDRPDDFERLAPWARLWQTWTSAVFLRAYRAAVDGRSFLPHDPESLVVLLRSFTLDKALYELLYELNHRPDWVRIPIQGILWPVRPDSPRGRPGVPGTPYLTLDAGLWPG